MQTSRCSRPRTTVERRYRGSRPASVIRSNRAAALAMTALVFMRASSAPMHWCTPCPNAACLGPLRAMSSRSGSLNAASSRFAAAKQRGAYRGRPSRIDMEAIKHRLAMGLSPTDIARELGISRGTVYKARAGPAYIQDHAFRPTRLAPKARHGSPRGAALPRSPSAGAISGETGAAHRACAIIGVDIGNSGVRTAVATTIPAETRSTLAGSVASPMGSRHSCAQTRSSLIPTEFWLMTDVRCAHSPLCGTPACRRSAG